MTTTKTTTKKTSPGPAKTEAPRQTQPKAQATVAETTATKASPAPKVGTGKSPAGRAHR